MAKSMTITASTRIPVKAKDGTDGSDGNGVKKATITYQIGSSGTTAPTGTWLADPPTAQKGKYLWTRTVTVFTNNSETVAYSVSYYGSDGENGSNGLPGAVSVKKKWVQGDTHVRDNDIVHYLYVDRGTKAASDWYRLAENRTINSAGAPPATSVVPTYYERVTSMMTLQVDAFIANEANVAGLIMKDGVLWSQKGKRGNNEVDYDGLSGFSPNTEINGKTGEIKTRKGTFETVTVKNSYLQNVDVTGSIRAPFTKSDGIVVDLTPEGAIVQNSYISDNLMLKGGGSWVSPGQLAWAPSQSGRRLFLTFSKFGNEESTGKVSFSIPSGKFFFENGRRITGSMSVASGQFLELLGYGDKDEFYGWIVINRGNLRTAFAYGRQLNVVAQGIVTSDTSSASIKYKTFDNLTMSVTKLAGAAGSYRVYFPTTWFDKAEDYIVMLTGFGFVLDNPTSPSKATLLNRENYFFDVMVSDDATPNNGNFMFQVINLTDWDE